LTPDTPDRPDDLEIGIEDAELALSHPSTSLLDVREEWEFRRRRVPGATLVPLGRLSLATERLAREGLILVICEHGNRSLAAADFLRRRGFDAVSVRGGTAAWARAGKPVEQG